MLLRADMADRDLTVQALGLTNRRGSAAIFTRESGVAAGLEEAAMVLRGRGVEVLLEKGDGDFIRPGDVLLRASGEEAALLPLERVVLNLLQRMCAIATAACRMQERVRGYSPHTRIAGTRKTLWGLLDKRALHAGGVGTHRLSLGDAILIKNNHLARIAAREEDAVAPAIERAWAFRGESAFIEVEVRGQAAAREAAKAFLRLREAAGEDYPCLLMLDNMTPLEISSALDMLRRESLWDAVLVEASGKVTGANLDGYAASGVDAISVGSLTHSVEALDIAEAIS